MKLVIAFSLIFIFACTGDFDVQSKREKLNKSLLSSYSEKDKSLAKCAQSIYQDCKGVQCFQKAQGKCLPKESKRNPASAMAQIKAQQMIDMNAWFFLSPSLITNFYHFFQTLKKASEDKEVLKKVKQSIVEQFHGVGVGITGSAFFGANKNWTAEIIHHNKEIALFCAPGNGMITDGGVSLGAVAVTTLGCRDHSDYEGTFLSGSFGVSGEIFLVPLGAEIAYSFGIDSESFNEKIRELKRDETFNFKTFLYEFNLVQSSLSGGKSSFIFQSIASLARFLFKEKQDQGLQKREVDTSMLQELLKRKISIGKIIKDFNSSSEFQAIVESNGLTHLNRILDAFASSLTGCDSFAGSASLSLSASPISFGLNQSYYTRVVTIKGSDAKILGALSLASLGNPILLAPSTIPLIIKYVRSISNIDDKIKACISADIKDFENFVIFKD